MRGHKRLSDLISKLADQTVTRSATRSLISLEVFANLPASDQIALLEATLENGALQLLMHSQAHISKLFHYLSPEAQDHIIKDDRFNFLLERAHKPIVDVTNSDFPDYSSARPGTLYVKKHKPLYTLKRVLPPNNKTTPKPGEAIAHISEEYRKLVIHLGGEGGPTIEANIESIPDHLKPLPDPSRDLTEKEQQQWLAFFDTLKTYDNTWHGLQAEIEYRYQYLDKNEERYYTETEHVTTTLSHSIEPQLTTAERKKAENKNFRGKKDNQSQAEQFLKSTWRELKTPELKLQCLQKIQKTNPAFFRQINNIVFKDTANMLWFVDSFGIADQEKKSSIYTALSILLGEEERLISFLVMQITPTRITEPTPLSKIAELINALPNYRKHIIARYCENIEKLRDQYFSPNARSYDFNTLINILNGLSKEEQTIFLEHGGFAHILEQLNHQQLLTLLPLLPEKVVQTHLKSILSKVPKTITFGEFLKNAKAFNLLAWLNERTDNYTTFKKYFTHDPIYLIVEALENMSNDSEKATYIADIGIETLAALTTTADHLLALLESLPQDSASALINAIGLQDIAMMLNQEESLKLLPEIYMRLPQDQQRALLKMLLQQEDTQVLDTATQATDSNTQATNTTPQTNTKLLLAVEQFAQNFEQQPQSTCQLLYDLLAISSAPDQTAITQAALQANPTLSAPLLLYASTVSPPNIELITMLKEAITPDTIRSYGPAHHLGNLLATIALHQANEIQPAIDSFNKSVSICKKGSEGKYISTLARAITSSDPEKPPVLPLTAPSATAVIVRSIVDKHMDTVRPALQQNAPSLAEHKTIQPFRIRNPFKKTPMHTAPPTIPNTRPTTHDRDTPASSSGFKTSQQDQSARKERT